MPTRTASKPRFVILTISVLGNPVLLSVNANTPMSSLWKPGFFASAMPRSKTEEARSVRVGAAPARQQRDLILARLRIVSN
jgi:hypothetical protein